MLETIFTSAPARTVFKLNFADASKLKFTTIT